jgi:predicted DNA-binding transcriptional regulator AlpA
MATAHPDDILTASDAGHVLGCTRDNVLRLVKRGVLPVALRTASKRPINLFRRSDVEALRARRRAART